MLVTVTKVRDNGFSHHHRHHHHHVIFMLAECSETTCNNVSKTTEGKKIQIIEIQINAKCNSVNALE